MTHPSQYVLVTGGGGFLGKAIVKQLLQRGDIVHSFSRGDYPELTAMGVTQIRGDLRDPEAVKQACKGMDTVFHTAAKAGVWGKYKDYHQTNVLGTEHVINACRHHNIPRLIYTSSASVVYNGKDMTGVDESAPYPQSYMTHYPKTKAMAEKSVVAAADSTLSTIVLRPHLIWGSRRQPFDSANHPAGRSTGTGGQWEKYRRHPIHRQCRGRPCACSGQID